MFWGRKVEEMETRVTAQKVQEENKKITQGGNSAGRMANLELLRIVAMMMVVVLHFLGKGGLLGDLTAEKLGGVGTVAWLLECFSIVAVNVYMLISGYFLCTSNFKLSRLLKILFQVWVYSVTFGLVGAITGVVEGVSFDIHYLLTLVFPISMGHYWFMTAYVFLYLLLPFVGMSVKKMTKEQLALAIGILFFAFCILKSVLPLRLEMDQKGYDCLWYLCVFLAAAYARRFGIPLLGKKWRCALLYVGGSLLIFMGTFVLRAVYLRTGSFERMLKMCLEYNHVLPFLAALGLFGLFQGIKVKGKITSVINAIAPFTLGVYLLHENIGLRYSWQAWFGAGNIRSVGGLVLWTLVAVLCVFTCGVLVDFVRDQVFAGIHRILCKLKAYRKLVDRIESADRLFQREA